MSNIEEDIKYVKECLKIARVFFKSIKAETDYKEIDDVAFCIAIDNILAERKQDKARIKELEEQVKNEIKGRDILAKLNEESIPKQKVKDKIEELKKDYEDSKDENGETEYYYPDYTIRKLEELLEDK